VAIKVRRKSKLYNVKGANCSIFTQYSIYLSCLIFIIPVQGVIHIIKSDALIIIYNNVYNMQCYFYNIGKYRMNTD